jgi:hypothetical protein
MEDYLTNILIFLIRMSVNQAAFVQDEAPSQFPFSQPKGDMFPPICIKSHWDPTAILRHTLPDRMVDLPLDFRPWQKVCKSYRTSGPAQVAPMPPKDMVFPQGGEFYPPGRYAASIDKESVLRTLDHPLDRYCDPRLFKVSPDSNMYKANYTVPKSSAPTSAFVQELAMPQAVLRESNYNCRSDNDAELWKRSGRLFNNPTKQDKFGSETYYALPGGKLIYPHGDVVPVPPTHQAKLAAGGPQEPPGGFHAYAGIKPIYTKPPPQASPAEPVGLTTTGWAAPS